MKVEYSSVYAWRFVVAAVVPVWLVFVAADIAVLMVVITRASMSLVMVMVAMVTMMAVMIVMMNLVFAWFCSGFKCFLLLTTWALVPFSWD